MTWTPLWTGSYFLDVTAYGSDGHPSSTIDYTIIPD